jgi:hypothetical protein
MRERKRMQEEGRERMMRGESQAKNAWQRGYKEEE